MRDSLLPAIDDTIQITHNAVEPVDQRAFEPGGAARHDIAINGAFTPESRLLTCVFSNAAGAGYVEGVATTCRSNAEASTS